MKLIKKIIVVGIVIMSLSMLGCSNKEHDEQVEKKEYTVLDYKKDLATYEKMGEYTGYIQENMPLKNKDEIIKDVERMSEKILELNMITPEGKAIQNKYPQLLEYVSKEVGDYCGNEKKLNEALEKMMFGNNEEYSKIANEMNVLDEYLQNKYNEFSNK